MIGRSVSTGNEIFLVLTLLLFLVNDMTKRANHKYLHGCPEQRNHWRITIQGKGLRWEEIDEDISVGGLLSPYDRTNG
ncbi:MAG: DUF2442 domain-containing protein [Chloroflexi bacterium]|nr:MAG: DUF2442 domain-containing protein [Chloroflexota bacterium]